MSKLLKPVSPANRQAMRRARGLLRGALPPIIVAATALLAAWSGETRAASTYLQGAASAGFGAEAITVGDNIGWHEGTSQAAKEATAFWGQASYAASAEFGALKVFASAATRGSGNYGGYEGWDSVASATVRAEDKITFSAPAGVSWVNFTLSLDLHGVMSGNGQSRGLLEADLGGFGYQPLEGQPFSTGVSTSTYFGYTPPGRGEVLHASKTFRAPAGGTISLTYTLNGVAYALPPPAQAGILNPSFMQVNGANTARVGITVLTPGASFLAESGASYAPVPEPSAWMLMAAGLLVAGAAVMQRRH